MWRVIFTWVLLLGLTVPATAQEPKSNIVQAYEDFVLSGERFPEMPRLPGHLVWEETQDPYKPRLREINRVPSKVIWRNPNVGIDLLRIPAGQPLTENQKEIVTHLFGLEAAEAAGTRTSWYRPRDWALFLRDSSQQLVRPTNEIVDRLTLNVGHRAGLPPLPNFLLMGVPWGNGRIYVEPYTLHQALLDAKIGQAINSALATVGRTDAITSAPAFVLETQDGRFISVSGSNEIIEASRIEKLNKAAFESFLSDIEWSERTPETQGNLQKDIIKIWTESTQPRRMAAVAAVLDHFQMRDGHSEEIEHEEGKWNYNESKKALGNIVDRVRRHYLRTNDSIDPLNANKVYHDTYFQTRLTLIDKEVKAPFDSTGTRANALGEILLKERSANGFTEKTARKLIENESSRTRTAQGLVDPIEGIGEQTKQRNRRRR